jgi:FlaA1/EpsC-like NDP-sugar epimerase
MNILDLIGRTKELFINDIQLHDLEIYETISSSRFLVIGGAGTIGQSVSLEIFKRDPKALHIVDVSENNLVELVRNIRSSIGYGSGCFRTYALDCGSREFEAFLNSEDSYDYVLNLSALKHVRSEKDPYTLMRMIDVNIFNVINNLKLTRSVKKYFCVSTDKAANPVNMMGGSKRIMEMFLMRESLVHNVSLARFANVAFSDGSLLHGFNQRFAKRQPISAPNDVKRYFVSGQESGELCLLSCLFGENRDIFFPKLNRNLNLITFSEIARNFLNQLGYEVFECATEDEARGRCKELIPQKKWPCYFFNSDTTGEKDFEEFYTEHETLDMERFSSIGIINNDPIFEEQKLHYFEKRIFEIKNSSQWNRQEIIELFHEIIQGFDHKEKGKFLDQRM